MPFGLEEVFLDPMTTFPIFVTAKLSTKNMAHQFADTTQYSLPHFDLNHFAKNLISYTSKIISFLIQ